MSHVRWRNISQKTHSYIINLMVLIKVDYSSLNLGFLFQDPFISEMPNIFTSSYDIIISNFVEQHSWVCLKLVWPIAKGSYVC